jgi:hypothetical protein
VVAQPGDRRFAPLKHPDLVVEPVQQGRQQGDAIDVGTGELAQRRCSLPYLRRHVRTRPVDVDACADDHLGEAIGLQ